MRRVIISVIFFGALVVPVMAGEITVKLSDEDQQGFANLPGALDACVAGLTLRGDTQMCKLVSQFAGQIGAKVAAAKPAPKAEPEKKPAK